MSAYRLQKLAITTLVSIGVAAFVLHMVLWFYWLDHTPRQPNPEAGQIYALNNHGTKFYVTQQQKNLETACPSHSSSYASAVESGTPS